MMHLPASLADAVLLSLDGQEIPDQTVPLLDDHHEHFVEMKAR